MNYYYIHNTELSVMSCGSSMIQLMQNGG